MSVLTEYEVQRLFFQGDIKEGKAFYVDKDTIITPSAKTFLMEKNIPIQSEKGQMENADEEVYETLFGAQLLKKPEFMTHLRGNTLVFKDHPRIVFRGAIDTLESEIILVQLESEKEGLHGLTEDLEEIIRFIRKLLRCEVSGDSLGEFQIQSLSAAELREYSHHPSKYFGIKHFLPSYKQGKIVALLNKLRTKTREVELSAYRAFKDDYGQVSRVDIIQGLNRLSSLFWIMMFKYLTDKYK